MEYSKMIIDCFTEMSEIDKLIESIEYGLRGGIHYYDIEPNQGVFNSEFLIKFIKINQGDNDYDYDLGRIGYKFLTSDIGLSELSKYYLSELKNHNIEYVSDETIENCKKSLLNIIK